MNKRLYSRILILLLTVLLLAGGMHVRAAEPVPDIEYIPIRYNNQQMDSLHGVPSLYNLDGYSIQWCNYLVERYYKTIYSIDIACTREGPVIIGNETGIEYSFQKLDKTELPHTGDIMFGPWYLRGYNMDHWALVKSFDQYNSQVTIFEQNWRYQGQAGVNRLLDYPTGYYYFYRLMTPEGEAEPTLSEVDQLTSEAGRKAVDIASRLGIATIPEGYRNAIDMGSFLTMCCNTIRAATGKDSFAEPDAPIAAAVALGLISDGAWQAEDTLTREQASVILVRLADLLAKQPETGDSILAILDDACRIEMAYRPYVARAVSLGLMNYTGCSFDPQAELTVEQALIYLTGLAQQPKCEILRSYTPAYTSQTSSTPSSENVVSTGSTAASAAASILGSLPRKSS